MFALLLMIYLLPVLVVLCLLVRIVRWSVVMILRISLKLIRRILRLSWCLICWLWHHAINRYREYRMRSAPLLVQMDFGDNREINVYSLLWDLSEGEAELSAEDPFTVADAATSAVAIADNIPDTCSDAFAVTHGDTITDTFSDTFGDTFGDTFTDTHKSAIQLLISSPFPEVSEISDTFAVTFAATFTATFTATFQRYDILCQRWRTLV